MAPRQRHRAGRRRLAPSILLLALALSTIYYARHVGGRVDAATEHALRTGGTAKPDATTPARVHGRMTKSGVLAVVSMLAEGHKWNDLLFPPDWVKRRLAGEKPEPPSKYCNPMFNDKYKLIYLKCPKNGGTTVMDGYFSHCDLPFHYDYCLHMADYTNTTEVAHLNKVWGEYFVFGFSRNVLRRALSQYKYLATFLKEECHMAWGEYCQDPYLIGDVCARNDSTGASCCTQVPPEHQYLHVSPQANCLTTTTGQYALDWLGRLENFYEDFAELLSILNARPGVPKIPSELPGQLNNVDPCLNRTLMGTKKGRAKARLLKCDKLDFYTGANEHCYDSIRQFYAEDSALLGL